MSKRIIKNIISLIVAVSENNVIGKNNQLIWHLPADLRYFKEKTLGKTCVMGRKTFDSIVQAIGRPLPERKNIVITRDPHFYYELVLRAGNLSEAIELAEKNIENDNDHREIMILGGASIYEQALPIANKIYLTCIHHTFEGDAFFPMLEHNMWYLDSEEKRIKDEKNFYDYTFQVYIKK